MICCLFKKQTCLVGLKDSMLRKEERKGRRWRWRWRWWWRWSWWRCWRRWRRGHRKSIESATKCDDYDENILKQIKPLSSQSFLTCRGRSWHRHRRTPEGVRGATKTWHLQIRRAVTQSFFSQVFTFCHSFTCFTGFHQFVISLTIILQRQLHFFWHSTLSAWPGQDGEVCDVVGWQSPNHPGREGQVSRKPCKIAALRLWLFFSSDFLMSFLIFYSLCWGNASVARVSQGRSAAWIMAESGLL